MLVWLRSNTPVAMIALAVLISIPGPAAALSQTPETSSKDAAVKSQDAAAPAKPDVSNKPIPDKPVTDKQSKEADALAQRQKQLADDTAKLLALANDLKAEMDKSTKDTLSLGVVKKAEAVEKMAHKVRDEMKKSMGN